MASLIGKTIGDYQIVEILDDAGDVVVFKGVQVSTNRSVAVKAINLDEAKDTTAVQRFTQHAELAARMQHPSILPVVDSGQIENVGYLVTPYMQNRSVADQRSSYTDPNQVFALFKALAPGLEYIYSQGSLHGNLQSKNIILDDNRQPLLTAFGLVFRPGAAPMPTNSPEQVQGGAVDQRTDIYALGVILYELLAGQMPTPGTALNLQSVRPDLPPGVDQVILKATAQNPDQRYQNTGELLTAFTGALQPAGEPTPAPTPAPPPPQPPPKKGFNWTGVILGVLLVAVLCLGAIVLGPMVMDYFNPEVEPTMEAPTAEVPTAEVPTELPPDEEPEPPPVETPEIELPIEDGGGLTEICNSLGLAGGIVLGGGIMARRRRRRSREKSPQDKQVSA
ncbi:MAG: serine/threonine-protein kinase [Anaerolineales bacterium]